MSASSEESCREVVSDYESYPNNLLWIKGRD